MNSTRNEGAIVPILTLITVCPILTIGFATLALILVYRRRLVSARGVSLLVLSLWALLALYGALHLFAWKPVVTSAAPFLLG